MAGAVPGSGAFRCHLQFFASLLHLTKVPCPDLCLYIKLQRVASASRRGGGGGSEGILRGNVGGVSGVASASRRGKGGGSGGTLRGNVAFGGTLRGNVGGGSRRGGGGVDVAIGVMWKMCALCGISSTVPATVPYLGTVLVRIRTVELSELLELTADEFPYSGTPGTQQYGVLHSSSTVPEQ